MSGFVLAWELGLCSGVLTVALLLTSTFITSHHSFGPQGSLLAEGSSHTIPTLCELNINTARREPLETGVQKGGRKR